jgi:hypothetical protein
VGHLEGGREREVLEEQEKGRKKEEE